MDKKPLLSVKNLSISFSKTVVHQVNFNLSKGESLALIGESGSGKTLTGLAIIQLLPHAAKISDESQIILGDQNLLTLSEAQMCRIRGRRIGMIFQEASTALNPVLTISEQINEILKRHFTLTKSARKQRLLDVLHEVGVEEAQRVANAYPHQLSGGLRQRAMIAMALAGDPEVLIADEPTTAIDVTLQAQILKLLRELQFKRKMSLLFITHDLGIIPHIADDVAVIREGKIIEQASTTQFFKNPQNEYSKKLLKATPHWAECAVRPLTADNKVILKVNNLRIYFPIRKGIFQRKVGDVKAVDGVNFQLYQGRTLALVGESGSGKTTTARGILQLIKPTQGTIQFQEKELTTLSSRRLQSYRRYLQIIFQDPYSSMDPRMLIGDILQEGMLAQEIGRNKKERQAMIDEMLQRVGLTSEMKDRYPHEFSGGQRQRICIARCLVMRPQLVICDEPTSALDIIVQMQILKLLRELQDEFQLSYLLITHNFGVVAYLADEVAVMYHGNIVEQGSVEQILFRPQQEYTKKLIAAAGSSIVKE